MSLQDVAGANRIAVVPLVGNQEGDEAAWLGALLAKLLGDHLRAAGVLIVESNAVIESLNAGRHSLPLAPASHQALRQELGLHAAIHGRYVLDDDAKMLGLALAVSAPDALPGPLEVSSPFAGFSRFMGRVALSVLEHLGRPIDDQLRQQLDSLAAPSSFEAFRQLARAYAAWARGQNELALAAITSALSLDAGLEEAAGLEVAIAQTAGDTATTRAAFRRWSEIAAKRGRPLLAAERLMLLGHWLVRRGEWEDARRAYDDSRNIFQREKSEEGHARALNNLANLELVRGRYQNAIQAYRRNLRVFEAGPDTLYDTTGTLYNLSLAHKNLGQHAEAERAIEQALALARQAKDTRLEARCLAQRGALLDDMGRWAQANIDYSTAVRLLDVLGDEKTLAMVSAHQAVLLKHQGDYDRAESLMLQALETLEHSGDPHEQAVVSVNLADLYLAMGMYDQAWDRAEQAHETLTQLDSGWSDRARDLLDTLESLPEEAPEEPLSQSESPLPLEPGPFVTLRPAQPPDLFGGANPYADAPSDESPESPTDLDDEDLDDAPLG